jgi:hypothetical protein
MDNRMIAGNPIDPQVAVMQSKPIEYFTYPELPDRPMFECAALRATLQVERCAGMWTEANGKNPPERLAKCRNCPIGALHAGEVEFDVSVLRGTGICSRCHRGGMRLIGGDICVSCWNRAREVIVGRNAKGKPPKIHPPLAPRSITVRSGGQNITIKREHSVSTDELVVAGLRDCTRQVLFGFSATRKVPICVQGELF